MKVFCMYYDRFETATTSAVLKNNNINHSILCHDNAKKFKNIHGKLIETKEQKGIQNNFNYALKLLNKNEWGVFMSDDYYKSYKIQNKKFIECDFNCVFNILIKTIETVDKTNIKLIGFNSTGNAFYANKKYSKYGLIDGRFFAIKKTEFNWHNKINCIPDYYATLYHLKKYGGNLIINYCYSDFKRNTKGGLGTLDERINDKIKNIVLLKNLYPENVIIKDKINHPKNSHIIIKK